MPNVGALGSGQGAGAANQTINTQAQTQASNAAMSNAQRLGGDTYLDALYQQNNPGGLTTSVAGGLSAGGPNSLAAYLLGGIAGQEGQYGYQGAIAGGQMGEAVAQEQLTNQEAQSTTGYNLANLLLSAEGTGLQSQGVAAQAGTAAAQQGVEQAQYGVQSGQYPEQMQEAALANANAVINARDQAAISGTTNTQGTKRAQATQGAEYGWQQADIFRAQQLAQLGQVSEQQGYAGQQEQLANQQAQLGLAAQGEGLSRDQAEAQLGFGLQQAGVSTAQDLYGFLGQAAAAQGGAAQTYAGALGAGSISGGLNPAFAQSLIGPTGG
jgi:hypothetical protein